MGTWNNLRLSIFAVFLEIYHRIPSQWDPKMLDRLLDFMCALAPDEIYEGSWLDQRHQREKEERESKIPKWPSLKPMRVTMLDGSMFEFPDELRQRAFLIKYRGEEEEALEMFRQITEKHWGERSIPTKFGSDVPWEEEYVNHGDLGHEVMYIYIRTAMMGVYLAEVEADHA